MAKQKNTNSKKQKNNLIAFLAIALFAVIGAFIITRSFAAPKQPTVAGPKLYITPSSQRVSNGQTIRAAVWVDTYGQPVNALQANINFDTRYFNFVRFDNTGSGFDVDAQSVQNNGSIQLARGSYNGVTGQKLITTIELQAKANVRSTSLTFGSGSEIINKDTFQNILVGTQKATYSIR